MLDVPRSVVLAAWAGAVAAGAASARDAVAAVTGTDEQHAVTGHPTGARDLAGLLSALHPTAAVRAVLPAPGDPSGLAGPPPFTAEAVDAGEAVLVSTADGALGLVPEVTAFGSAWEPGALTTWHAHHANTPAALPVTTVGDAQRELRAALTAATRALGDLDVARWREDAADRITAVRDGALRATTLPPGTPADVLAVATSAARVRAIVALASEDDGAAVTGSEAASRSRTLREVDAVARRALAVAAGASQGPQAASAAR